MKLRILVLGMFFLLFINGTMAAPTPLYESSSLTLDLTIDSLVTRGPITINNEGDFGGFPGSGSSSDPYIIENFNITGSSTAIYVGNIQSHFIIRNNYVNGMDSQSDGIVIFESINGQVINNTVEKFAGIGILLEGATSQTTVVNNEVFSSDNGIKMGNNGNTIQGNYIHDIIHVGIFGSNEGNHIIEDNLIHDIGEYGIIIDRGPDITIRNNTLYNFNQGGLGIWTDSIKDEFTTDRALVEYNNITVSNTHAMSVTASNTIIRHNIITGQKIMDTVGIEIGEDANGILVNNNTISSLMNGLSLWADQLDNQNHEIRANIITDMIFAGIILDRSETSIGLITDILITDNLIMDIDEGISDFGSHFTSVERNVIVNSASFGIKFEQNAANGSVIANDFISDSGALATSHSTTMIFEDNYWSGLDGTKYTVSGDASLEDITPVSEPYHMRIELQLYNFEKYAIGPLSVFAVDIVMDVVTAFLNIRLYNSLDNETWDELQDPTQNQTDIGSLGYSEGELVYFKVRVESDFHAATTHFYNYYYFSNPQPYMISPIELLNPIQKQLNGTVNIEWTEAEDNYGLKLDYSVYVLRSGDSDWTILSEDQTETSYEWDTTQFKNGEYLIRIVVNSEIGENSELVSSNIFTIENEMDQGILSLPGFTFYNIAIAILLGTRISVKMRKSRNRVHSNHN